MNKKGRKTKVVGPLVRKPMPQADWSTNLLKYTKVGLQILPFGGIAAELLSAIGLPYEKRKEKWMQDVAFDLEQLQKKFDDLAQDETFITTFLQAAQIAGRTHQKEKLEALRYAVLNSTLPDKPDDNMQSMFLSLVELLTPLHLRLTKFLLDPKKWIDKNQITIPASVYDYDEPHAITMKIVRFVILPKVFPDIRNDEELFYHLGNDLKNYGIANLSLLHDINIPQAQDRVTRFGKQFLDFIENPLEVK